MQHAGRSVIVSGHDRRDRPRQHGDPAAAVHPLDRDRRDADPARLGARVDHPDAGAAAPARAEDQPAARDAEAPADARRRRGRLLDALGAPRLTASAADLPARDGGRRPAPDPGARSSIPSDAETARAARGGGRGRRAHGADRRGDHAGRLQAVHGARRGHERPAEARGDRRRGPWHSGRRRCDGAAGRRAGDVGRTALLEAFSATDASSKDEPQGDLEPAEARAARRRGRGRCRAWP